VSSRAERLAVSVLLAATFLLFLAYSLNTPLFEASDELWHYPLVQHIATTGDLPIQHPNQTDTNAPWRQEGSQPPLYYVVASLVSSPFDSSNWRDVRRINPHGDLGRPTTDGNLNAVVHSISEQLPWTGAALAIHIARLVSILFSTFTVYFSWLVACELFPRSHGGLDHDVTVGDQTNSGYWPSPKAMGIDDHAWLPHVCRCLRLSAGLSTTTMLLSCSRRSVCGSR
jgi:hypothetical protein